MQHEYLKIISVNICFILFSIPIYAEMTAEDMTLQRVEGKTFKSKWNGYDLSTTFKKNGKVTGKTGPGGQWITDGTYKVREDGTICVDWNNPQWQDGCRHYGTTNTIITK